MSTGGVHPLAEFGTDEQRNRWLPGMLSGDQIGGYSLSEPQAGSDAAALRCAAAQEGSGYRINGSKSWITHGGRADSYDLFGTDRWRLQGNLVLPGPGRTPKA